jgi:hypothetical protein
MSRENSELVVDIYPRMLVPKGSSIEIRGAVFETLNDVTVEGASAENYSSYAEFTAAYDKLFPPPDYQAIAALLDKAGVNYAMTGDDGEIVTNQRD